MATAHEPHQAASKSQILRNELVLRDHALTYPETQEEFPWGHRALKVKGKSFLFLGNGLNGDEMSLSVKLRESHETALLLPFAEPTGYGLGKSGWITARFPAGEDPPLPLLMGWIDESYRLIAPKRLVATVATLGSAEPSPAAPAKKKARATSRSTPARRTPRS